MRFKRNRCFAGLFNCLLVCFLFVFPQLATAEENETAHDPRSYQMAQAKKVAEIQTLLRAIEDRLGRQEENLKELIRQGELTVSQTREENKNQGKALGEILNLVKPPSGIWYQKVPLWILFTGVFFLNLFFIPAGFVLLAFVKRRLMIATVRPNREIKAKTKKEWRHNI